MAHTAYKNRLFASIGVFLLLVPIFSTLLAGLSITPARAYLYKDTSITTKDACDAVNGTFGGIYSGGSGSTWCTHSSAPSDDAPLILAAGWLADCIYSNGSASARGYSVTYSITAGNLQNYQFDKSGDGIIGHILSTGDGTADCKNTTSVKANVSRLGFSDMLDMFKYLGATENNNTGNYMYPSFNSASDIYSKLVTHEYSDATLTDYDRYYIALKTFEIGCQATQIISPTAADINASTSSSADNTYSVALVTDASWTPSSAPAVYTAKLGKGKKISTINSSVGWPGSTFTCIDLANKTKEYAPAYASWLFKNPAIADAANLSLQNTNGTGTPTSSCVVDGVGWIVCSVANFVAKVTDGIYGIIEHMISVPAINTDTSSGANGVYNVWSIMRNFANLAFVIVFLIIIFSQLTGIGVSNYGVKKTLPRLVVAAILVNVSFWLSAILVDISNIMGAGIYDLLSGVKDRMNIGISSNWESIISALLAGSTVTVAASGAVVAGALFTASTIASGGGMSLLFLALPVVLAAVLAVLVLIFILIARQALVIILIGISPLAFVAMLLPNTQKYFTKWRQTLTSLLLMYPIVSLIFGGAQVAGLTMLSAARNPGVDAVLGGIYIISGQVMMVAPFFFLPTILRKFSGGNLDSVAATLTNKGKGLIGGISGMSRKAGRAGLARTWNKMKYANPDTSGYSNTRRRLSQFGKGLGSAGRIFDETSDKNTMTDSFLREERSKNTRARLADESYATAVAGGDAAEGKIYSSRAIAAAESEELKKALEPLRRTLATLDPGDKREHLKA